MSLNVNQLFPELVKLNFTCAVKHDQHFLIAGCAECKQLPKLKQDNQSELTKL